MSEEHLPKLTILVDGKEADLNTPNGYYVFYLHDAGERDGKPGEVIDVWGSVTADQNIKVLWQMIEQARKSADQGHNIQLLIVAELLADTIKKAMSIFGRRLEPNEIFNHSKVTKLDRDN